MDNRPLSYDALKSIIRHLDPNLRLKVGQQIPSLKKTEKVVPLKLDVLDFKPTGLTVNDTEYIFTLHIEHHENSPESLKTWINNHKREGDLDEFGVPDFPNYELTTGDIILDQVTWLENIQRAGIAQTEFEHFINDVAHRVHEQEEIIEKLLEKIWMMDTRLENIRRKKENNEPVSENEEQEAERCVAQKKMYLKSIEKMRVWIDNCLADLPILYYSRDKVKPPYDAFLQLVIKKSSGTEVLRKPYNQKIHEAVKKLTVDLLGGRRHVIDVKSLNFSYATILRLPENVKFRVQEIGICGISTPLYVQLDVLSCIIDESSFPLECLKVDFDTRSTNDISESLKHPIAQNSECLMILGDVRGDVAWLPILTELKNRSVSFILNDFGIVNHIQFIQSWLETGREIGASFAFSFDDEEECVKVVNLIKRTFNQDLNYQRVICLPMHNSMFLDICLSHDDNDENDVWHGIIMGVVEESAAPERLEEAQEHPEFEIPEPVKRFEESESVSGYDGSDELESSYSECGSGSEDEKMFGYEESDGQSSKPCPTESELKPEEPEAPKPENSSFGDWLIGKLRTCLRSK